MTPLEVAILITVFWAVAGVIWLVRTIWSEYFIDRRNRPKQYTIHLDGSKYFEGIDEAEVNRLVHEKLQVATEEAVTQFKTSLTETMPKLVTDVRQLHETEVKKQFANYSQQFEELNQEAIDTFAQVHDDLMKRHAELAEGLNKRVVADYKSRMAAFDERLDDVVSGYVLESLGTQVDLGAQLPYILDKIEENKEQIKKDMTI